MLYNYYLLSIIILFIISTDYQIGYQIINISALSGLRSAILQSTELVDQLRLEISKQKSTQISHAWTRPKSIQFSYLTNTTR